MPAPPRFNPRTAHIQGMPPRFPKRAPAAQVAPPRPPRLNPDQWAQKQAEKYIAAQVAAIQEQQRIYLEELRRQAQVRMQQGQALASWLQGQNFPGRIQDVYRTAGSDITGYAQGFGTDIRNIASADAAEQTNMLSGTGQEGAVRNEGQGMSDVMYGAYGLSPARKFAETGAAFASDAALQPAFATQIAGQEAYDLQQEGMGQLVEFAKAIAEARSGKAGLAQEFLDRRLKMQYEREDRQVEAQDREREWFLKMAAYYNAMGDDRRAEQYLRLAQQRNARSAAGQRGLNPNGTPKIGYHIDTKSGKVVKDGWHHVQQGGRWVPKKDKSPSSKQGTNWAQVQKDMAGEDLTVTEQGPPTRVGNISVPGEEITRNMTRKEAYQVLWAKYSGFAKTNAEMARLRRLINQILDAKGIKKPAQPQVGGR